jgi:penicillin-insensitive murein DD-endopeptidase
MVPIQPKDARGFFMLPQKPEDAGYYTYGTPVDGGGQYADPRLLSLLLLIEHRWQGMDDRKIGIGNISLANGAKFEPHQSHRSGRDVDIRLFRKDRQQAPVTRFDEEYDQDATAKLIGMFWESSLIQVIYFNDRAVPRVTPLQHHDDHFHVTIKPPKENR